MCYTVLDKRRPPGPQMVRESGPVGLNGEFREREAEHDVTGRYFRVNA